MEHISQPLARVVRRLEMRMSGRSSKRKGTVAENEVVHLLEAAGIQAHRQPYSGATQRFPFDVEIPTAGRRFYCEVKKRANGEGFTTLERWKKKADFLILRRNHAKPMVCMDWEQFEDLITAYNQAHEEVFSGINK